MKRVFLLIATNLAVMLVLGVVLSIVMPLLGIHGTLDRAGNIDLKALLIISAVVGFTGSFISLAMSKWTAKRMTGARVIEQPRNADEAWLFNTVQSLAQRAGIGMPEIAMYDSPEMNAFATGMRRDAALVAVSTGLLRTMKREEIEAVLGHEITHVANGDMVTLTLIQGVVNTFVFFLSRVIGHFVDRVILRSDRGYGPGYYLTAFLAQIVLGILASAIVMWFSRHREFRADAGGAKLAGRDRMIAALERLRSGQPQALPDQLAAFGISGGGGKRGLKHLFMSHPPIEDRIAALRSQ